jgi:hypothetical protein
LDESQHLPALCDEGVIRRAANLEPAPEANAFELLQPAIDAQPVAQFRGTPIVNLSPHDHWISVCLGHFDQFHAEVFREQSARHLDESQVSDVVHNRAAVRVEEHNLNFDLDPGSGLRVFGGRHSDFEVSGRYSRTRSSKNWHQR